MSIPDSVHPQPSPELRSAALRALLVGLAVVLAFGAVAAQLVRLGVKGQAVPRAAPAEIVREVYSRPDIVDRNGRLLASDVAIPTLFANPSMVQSVDETVERLSTFFPHLDSPKTRQALADKRRKYYQLKRAVAPAVAERIYALGLPGIDFKWEPKRSYPGGRLAGHVLGHVDAANHGRAGIERFLNANPGVDRVHSARVNTSPPLRLSIDMRAQYGLERELADAMARYQASAATGIVIDVASGEIPAAASAPGVDPSLPTELLDKQRMNRLADDAFELGSVFKVVTIAMALETGIASPTAQIDVSRPLVVGRFSIKDPARGRGWLSLTEVFTKSSNVGAGILAQAAGAKRQRAFLSRLGLTQALAFADVRTVAPKLPAYWGEAETITIGYGHGLAVSPLQFAVAVASLVNGGYALAPTFRSRSRDEVVPRRAIVSAETSAAVRRMMRRNVHVGTGKGADVPGYRVGGKTGTADLASHGRYDGKAVITSFVAAFPIDRPRYVVLVTLFDPMPDAAKSVRTAGRNAAPTAGRVIARLAPLLGVAPR